MRTNAGCICTKQAGDYLMLYIEGSQRFSGFLRVKVFGFSAQLSEGKFAFSDMLPVRDMKVSSFKSHDSVWGRSGVEE